MHLGFDQFDFNININHSQYNQNFIPLHRARNMTIFILESYVMQIVPARNFTSLDKILVMFLSIVLIFDMTVLT